MNTEDKLDILREILLTDDRELAQRITQKLDKLEKSQGNLSARVQPIIDENLQEFIKEMPLTLGPTITKTLQTEIRKSQDAVAEALYPVMGKMIKKYVQNEIKVLQEKINEQISHTFSFKRWAAGFKSKKSREQEAAHILADQYKAHIEQVMVIEKSSGILKGNLAITQKIDQDMMAGMLTAIKSFAEDAFITDQQNLEAIAYDLYTIHVQNFSEYYIAVVISGIYNATVKSKLEDILLDFAQNEINEDDIKDFSAFKLKLTEYFKYDII